jgi:hypothetical protein
MRSSSTRSRFDGAARISRPTSVSEMMRFARLAPRWEASERTLMTAPALKGV